MKILLLSLLLLGLFGCASTPPSALISQPPANDISLTEVDSDYQQFLNSTVRWGGRVLKAVEVGSGEQKKLHLEILEYPLDEQGKPIDNAKSGGGRFIARLSQPFKKSHYYRTRRVTISGQLTEAEVYPLASGEEQKLPVVDVGDKYAWRKGYDDDYRRNNYWPYRLHFRYGIGYHYGHHYHHGHRSSKRRSSLGVGISKKIRLPHHR